MLLTDEEIKDLVDRDYPMVSNGRWVAKAQLKKVAKRGSELCRDHKVISGTERWQCRECWRALLEEVKDAV